MKRVHMKYEDCPLSGAKNVLRTYVMLNEEENFTPNDISPYHQIEVYFNGLCGDDDLSEEVDPLLYKGPYGDGNKYKSDLWDKLQSLYDRASCLTYTC